jgi:lysophospholipase L1-like esterase
LIRRAIPLLSVLLVCAAAPAVAGARTSQAKKTHSRYYLALGDSLSQGMQPDPQGTTLNTHQGYVDDLFAVERHHVRELKLVKYGCGGETTQSMITGKGNEANARKLHCVKRGGSQLKAAERFLRSHHRRGEVALVTIDIGANDVDGCISAADPVACAIQGAAQIKHDLPIIYKRLRAAAPKGTRFAAMTLYDPVLAGYFNSDPKVRGLASASVGLLKAINDDIAGADARYRFLTADVAGAFDTYDTARMVQWENQSIPIDVARVCSWTWACTTPPSGPNIHANKNGYEVIAGTFERVLGRLR